MFWTSVFGQRRAERIVHRPALADHELTHAALAVERPVGRLRREALVGVVVPAEHPFGAVLVEQLPERGRVRQASRASRRRSSAGGASRRRRSSPAFAARSCCSHCVLLGARAAAADLVAVAVQHDDVPGAEVVAVPALARGGRGRAEVVEVAGSAGGAVLVVAHGRLDARLVAAPARVEAAGELVRVAVVLLGVARDGDRAGERVEQARDRLVAARPAGGDVGGGEQRRVARVRRGGRHLGGRAVA